MAPRIAALYATLGPQVAMCKQSMLFLNVAVLGMLPQAAIEAPRFSTHSYPGSFEPHAYQPDELRIERRLAEQVGATLVR
jgi:gamma-glutamyltranspeptidase/glutathione hydrolase